MNESVALSMIETSTESIEQTSELAMIDYTDYMISIEGKIDVLACCIMIAAGLIFGAICSSILSHFFKRGR